MRKRRISEFMCKELLYDFATEQLDSNRKRAVQEYLDNDAEMRIELQSIEFALKYLDELKKTEISEPYIEKLNTNVKPNIFSSNSKLFKYTRNIAVIFLLIFASGKMFSVDFHSLLNRIDSDSVVLAEIEPEVQETILDESVDESITENQDLVEEELIASNTDLGVEDGVESEVNSEPESAPITLNPNNIENETAAEVAVQEDIEPETTAQPVAAKQGEVYWSFMKIQNLDLVSPSLINRIEELGGNKAGSVRLGWTKPNGRRYFHFKMPKKNYEVMMNYLKTLGKLNVVKAPHRRIMPEGTYRFVLEIENTSPSGVSSQPTGKLSE